MAVKHALASVRATLGVYRLQLLLDVAVLGQVPPSGLDGMCRFDRGIEDGAGDPPIGRAQLVEEVLDLPRRQFRQNADDLPLGEAHVMPQPRHLLTQDLSGGAPYGVVAQFVVCKLEDELERHPQCQRRRQSLRFERRRDVRPALALLLGQGAATHRRLSNASEKSLCCSRRCVHRRPDSIWSRYISRSPVRIL